MLKDYTQNSENNLQGAGLYTLLDRVKNFWAPKNAKNHNIARYVILTDIYLCLWTSANS